MKGFDLLQLIVAVIGLAYNLWTVWDSMLDIHRVRRSNPDDLRLHITQSNFNQELIRLFVMILFVMIGIVTIVAWWADEYDLVRRQLVAAVVRSCIIAATILLAFKSALDKRDRKVAVDLWDKDKERRKVIGESPTGEDRRSHD